MATTTVLYRLVGQDSGASRTFDNVGRSAERSDRMVRNMAVGGEIVGEALLKAADDSVHFESSMKKVQTQAGASAKDVTFLSAAVLKLAPSTQQGPQKLSEALFHLKSVGLDNAKAMLALKTSSDLAAVGGSDLEATTNALAGAWRTGIKGATDFGQAAGTVNAIIGAGNMRMQDLVDAIGTGILPSAKAFGLSFGQVGAALALMTDEGVPASDAATRLRMSLSLLGAASPVADKQLKRIGLTSLELGTAMRGKDGIIGAISLLKGHLDESGLSAVKQTQLISHAFGGGRSSSAIISMVNNLDVLKLKQEQINASTGKYGAAVVAQRKTAEAQLHMLESAAETASIRVGNAILPPLTKFAGWVNSTGLPTISKVTHALEAMVPTARIQSGLDTAKRGLTGFFQTLTGSGPKAPKPVHVAVQDTAARLQVPRFIATTAGGTAVAATRLQIPEAGLGQTNAQRLQVPTGPHASLTTALPAPDVSGWQRAGTVVRKALKDTAAFLAPVGTALLGLRSIGMQALPPVEAAVIALAQGAGKLLLPAIHLVGTFITATLVPTLHNVATTVMPLLGLLKPLATAVGVTLYLALVATGFVLNSVVGPALVAVTGWMAHNRAAVAVLAGAILLLNADLLITKAQGIAASVAGFVTMRAQAVASRVSLELLRVRLMLLGLQQRAQAVATGLSTAAQRLWNTAMVQSLVTGGRAVVTWLALKVQLAATAVWQGIVTAAQWAWNVAGIASDGTTWLLIAGWVALKAQMAATAVWQGIVTAAQWAWNLAMTANPIGLVVVAIAALVGGIIWVATKTTWFQTIWKFTWGAIQNGALAAWKFLDKWVVQPIARAFTWLWEKGIQPSLRFIVDGFLSMVGTVLQGAVDMMGWMPGIGPELKGALKAFNSFRDGVNAALGGIQAKTVPVTVTFGGVPEGKITGHSFTSTTGFTYARGGPIPEWLGVPNKDSVPILAMGGEFVVNKRSTAKHRRLIEAINADDVKAYAGGGMVGFDRAVSSDMALASRIDIAKQVKAMASAYAKAYNASAAVQGLAWARTQVGQPYQWGGNGNPSWDCSGFMSAIESVMRGESPHRRWATGAFSGATAPPGWKLGAKAAFRIGVTNAGVGHTAGTLNGVNVEMSTVGGRVGGGARGADDSLFPAQYGLVGFDKGGIARGKGYMPKMTHQPERVLSPRQTAAFEQLVAHLTQSSGAGNGAGFTKLGAAIPAGVAAGVKAGAPGANAAMTDLGKGLQSAFATELQISSPSKKTRTLAAYTIDGLVQGFTGSTASVRSAARRVANYLYVDFGATGHKALQDTVARDSKALLALANRRDAVATRLKAANKNLAQLQKSWAQEQSSVADSIMQSSSVVVDATNTNAMLTATQVVGNFATQSKAALAFAADLHKLEARGLNAAMVQQIAAAGVSGGAATARALASANSTQIHQLNQMQKTTVAASDKVGAAVADSMYGAGIRTAQGLVAGLRSQEKAIDHEMLRIALAMQKAIKVALGIHSPSTVAKKIGVFFPQGLGEGVTAGTHHAVSAAKAMSKAVEAASRPGGLGRGMAPQLASARHMSGPRQAAPAQPQPAAAQAPAGGQFTGSLYLDSGEFLGAVKGTVVPLIRASEQEQARRARVGRRG